MKIREILRCKNCPNLGAHVHYDGKTEFIGDNEKGLQLAEIEGIGLEEELKQTN
jgi:hypothetical protein